MCGVTARCCCCITRELSLTLETSPTSLITGCQAHALKLQSKMKILKATLCLLRFKPRLNDMFLCDYPRKWHRSPRQYRCRQQNCISNTNGITFPFAHTIIAQNKRRKLRRHYFESGKSSHHADGERPRKRPLGQAGGIAQLRPEGHTQLFRPLWNGMAFDGVRIYHTHTEAPQLEKECKNEEQKLIQMNWFDHDPRRIHRGIEDQQRQSEHLRGYASASSSKRMGTC